MHVNNNIWGVFILLKSRPIDITSRAPVEDDEN